MKGLFDSRGSSSLQVENAALDQFTAAFRRHSLGYSARLWTTLAVQALVCAAIHVPCVKHDLNNFDCSIRRLIFPKRLKI